MKTKHLRDIHLRIDPKLADRFMRYVDENYGEGATVSAVVRKAIKEFLDREDKQRKS